MRYARGRNTPLPIPLQEARSFPFQSQKSENFDTIFTMGNHDLDGGDKFMYKVVIRNINTNEVSKVVGFDNDDLKMLDDNLSKYGTKEQFLKEVCDIESV